MDADIYMMYLQGMNQIENEELLISFSSNSYSQLKEDARKKLHKQTYKLAFPNQFNKPKNIVKLSDLKKVLR
jgi:hypothetical protein